MHDLQSRHKAEDRYLMSVVKAAQDTSIVSGLTHSFYRYPARFSPNFVRSVIEAFTSPGDWVVDPFVGGGTSLVEALALGRHSLGVDISALACFVSQAKTLVLDNQEVSAFERWRARMPQTINMHRDRLLYKDHSNLQYYKHLEGRHFWRLRKAIEQSLASAISLQPIKSMILARCVVLRAAQWALDGRQDRPSVPEFRDQLVKFSEQMIEASIELRDQRYCTSHRDLPATICLNRSAAGLDTERLIQSLCPPKLIVTSPPYPGIHVLYHRWQIDGRREAPAPFWIAGKTDGAGSSFYTMGDRKKPMLHSYFENLREAFTSISRIMNENTTLVQILAFSEADWQLPKYLDVMNVCGLHEQKPWQLNTKDGRLWRNVPNRKWHAHQKACSPGAREVVLVHKKLS